MVKGGGVIVVMVKVVVKGGDGGGGSGGATMMVMVWDCDCGLENPFAVRPLGSLDPGVGGGGRRVLTG